MQVMKNLSLRITSMVSENLLTIPRSIGFHPEPIPLELSLTIRRHVTSHGLKHANRIPKWIVDDFGKDLHWFYKQERV